MIRSITIDPLPGCQPYSIDRVIKVRQELSGLTMIEFLCRYHPPTSRDQWARWLEAGAITREGRVVGPSHRVQAGDRYLHHMQNVTEPEVCGRFEIVHEDESLIVLNKSAPLPVHPSGRFYHNTLSKFLETLYPTEKLRLAHRLDANTTGIVIFARNAETASSLQPQFAERSVKKAYVARVTGIVPWVTYECDLPIGVAAELQSEVFDTRGARIAHPKGMPSHTSFRRLDSLSDGTSLVEAFPLTGRTNQIRVHLAALGFPIVGDPLYLGGHQWGTQQTLRVDQPPMCLHAESLTFTHPAANQPVTFHAPLPA